MVITLRNAFALARDLAANKVCHISGNGAPVDGKTGKGVCGRGSFYFDVDTGVVYINSGTDKLQNWGQFGGSTSPQAAPLNTVTAAEVGTGKTLVTAVAAYKIKLTSVKIVTKGADAGGITTLDILGTQAAASVKLFSFPVALLKKDVAVTSQSSGVVLLSPIAKSFQACDVNTPITIAKTGAALTGATSFEVNVSYALTT